MQDWGGAPIPRGEAVMMPQAFRSLRNRNFRLWSIGAVVSNTGTWFQRIAQDWLVLTQLTDHRASAVGIVMALQAAPTILLLPYTGAAADRLDRRKLLMVTQASQALLALVLGILAIENAIALWGVYVIAFLFGCATAFDSPARHTFASDLVGEDDIANAVALNSTSFNMARLVGPAVAGAVIAATGVGWAFLINGASFVAVLCSLFFLRTGELHPQTRSTRKSMQLLGGFRYIRQRPELATVMLMTFFIGTFGLNFPIFISTMSASVFHTGAARYGLLMSIMALGSLGGALFAAHHSAPSIRSLTISATIFGAGLFVAGLSPTFWIFGATLTIVGGASVSFTTATSSFMQLVTEQAMRGRVASIRLAVGLGGTLIGGPIMGAIADRLGPRTSVVLGATSGFVAALLAIQHLSRERRLRGAPVAEDIAHPSNCDDTVESAGGVALPDDRNPA